MKGLSTHLALFSAFALMISGCSHIVPIHLQGRKEPMKAAEACVSQASIKLEEDGHKYTTYRITDIAGYNKTRKLTLSYFSQYPDLDPDYDAINATVRYFFVPWYWGWHNKINGILHSLHDGDQAEIDQRRIAIKNALLNSLKDPSQDWLSGLLIHAYGDAYVHTSGKYRSGQEDAYGPWWGHAWDYVAGNNPDGIKNPVTEPKYLAYVDELYHVLRSDEPPDQSNTALETFKREVKEMQCSPGECPILQAVSDRNPESSIGEVKQFGDCMMRDARALKPSEVEDAISRIKEN